MNWFVTNFDLKKILNKISSDATTIKGDLKKMADGTTETLKPIADALLALQAEVATHNASLASIEAELQVLAAAVSAGLLLA